MEKLSGLFWGWGPCMLQGLNHRLLETQTWILWNPKCSKSLPLFSHRTWSLGSKGPGILLSKQQNQGTKCVMWHMKQSIWSTDLERPVTQVTTSLVPRSELCNNNTKFLGAKYRTFPAGFWDLIYSSVFQLLNTEMSLGLLASTIEHNSLVLV